MRVEGQRSDAEHVARHNLILESQVFFDTLDSFKCRRCRLMLKNSFFKTSMASFTH